MFRANPLTRGQQKKIKLLRNEAEDKEISAQDSIPYRKMYPDGICRVTENRYSRCIRFEDTNYQLLQPDAKTGVFDNWCSFLNYFDSSVSFELTFLVRPASREKIAQRIEIPIIGDSHDYIREEFETMLRNLAKAGRNRFSRTKYLSYSIEAENLSAARSRLSRIEADILANFKSLDVEAVSLDGTAYLEVMYNIFHIDTSDSFRFSWDDLVPAGLNTKDYIAPSSFEFRTGKQFSMGGKPGAVSFLQILASKVSDRILSYFLNMETPMVLSIHFRSVNQTEAIKLLKHKLSDIDKSKIDEQKKAVRAGYDIDILPSDLNTYGAEAKRFLEDLQNRDERLFFMTFVLMNVGGSQKQLNSAIAQASGIAQQQNCALTRLDFQQEEGLMSCLPLANNLVKIERNMSTAASAGFMPFTTQELFQQRKEALYYGVNALSGNLIMADRKALKNPNGLILGTPGSGKSFAAKREITNAFLVCPDDDIIICDPEAEYGALVEKLGGQVIRISPVSQDFLNPMDLNLDYSDEDEPLALKTDFILSLCELITGRRDGLLPVEKSVIDRCVPLIYQTYLHDQKPENMPTLGDLYDALRKQAEPEAKYIATSLEIYVNGSLSVFNHRTTADVNSRIVVYDIKQLGKQLRKLGMLIVQDQVWNRVTINRAAKKSTRFYCDEFHLLLNEAQTAAYSVEIWKRFRKWGGIPTGITQNIKDFLHSAEVSNIFENSDFVLMLNQGHDDQEILAKHLNISKDQLRYVTQSGEGQGLLYYGNTILPFIDHFPKDTELYKIMSTKFSDE